METRLKWTMDLRGSLGYVAAFLRRLGCCGFAALLILSLGCKSGGGVQSGVGGRSGSGGAPDAGGGAGGTAGGTNGAGGLAGTGGLAGAAGSAGAAAGADGGIAPDGGDFPDPVKGSEADTTLDGTDANANGVRDDVDAYVATLEADPRKRTALLSFARESTAMMMLGGAAGTTKAAAVAQAQRVGRTIDCLHDLYVRDLVTKQTILQNVRNALYDNAMRLRAYNHASTLLSGTLLRAGRGCDAAITGVSP